MFRQKCRSPIMQCMSKGIIDALYWRLHRSYLLNRREEAFRLLDMLEDEAGSLDIACEIGPVHAARLYRIAEEVRSGRFGPLHGGHSVPAGMFLDKPDPSGEEKAFHAVLMTKAARNCLLPLLDMSPKAIMSHEHDLGQYGRVDFLVRDGRRIAVIEVKMGPAPRSSIPQVDGYRTASELDMCMGMWDIVDAIVLAESFPQPVAAELARLGVRMILHRGGADWFGLLNP